MSDDPAPNDVLRQLRTDAPGEDVIVLSDSIQSHALPLQTEPCSTLSQNDRTPVLQPQSTGRFELIRELGRGGMGIVYQAFDRHSNELVALKTLQHIDPQALYRFKREFRSLAGLAHPNLVTLYELISDGQQWFFTMELVEGYQFLKYVRSGGNPDQAERAGTRVGLDQRQLSRLRAALGQLANGIQALHNAGKLHRDIKPGNVLVTRVGRVVVLDFGLVAELDHARLHESTDPSFQGTIAYMAPEQAAVQPLSPACDWYALGTILYEALTDRLPFCGRPLDVLLNKQQHDPPPPAELVPDVPDDLNCLCVELLRRDPIARPSGEEILARLGRLGHEPSATECSSNTAAPGLRLVGRQRHLATLAEAFQTMRQGHTVSVFVHGASGVGKTALLQCFLDGLTIRGEAVVLGGRCYEQESVPYKALDSLVDSLTRYLARQPALEVQALLPRDVQTLARVFPVLQSVAAVSQAPRRALETSDVHEVRRRALAALRELLGRLGDRQPLVLAIDDLQWGDLDSAVLLADLLQPPDAPTLLFVGCSRSDKVGQNTSPLGAFLKRQSSGIDCFELAIEPLTPAETKELALALLDPLDEAAEGHADEVVRESEGSPFFVQELVQHLQVTVGQHATGSETSATLLLKDVLWKRILQLPALTRCLLEVVAVAGQPLRPVDACQAAGLAMDEQRSALAYLRSARLLRGTGRAEKQEIETYHDRVRETVVSHLAPPRLREYHHRLALTLEAAGQASPDVLAVHFQGAGLTAHAGGYYALAAARAAETLAFDRAATLYRLALDLQSAPVEERRVLRVRLADVLVNAGRGAESAREYLAATAGASAQEALELRRRAALQLLSSGHVEDGLATLRTVLAQVGMKLPSSTRWAVWSLLFRQAQLRLRGLSYRPREASAVPAADLTRLHICWSAAVGLSMVDMVQGALFQTHGLLMAIRAGEPFCLLRALAMETAHVSIGGSRSQRRTAKLLAMTESVAKQMREPYAKAAVSLAKGVAAAFAGNWPAGLAHSDEADQVFQEHCTGVSWEQGTAHRFALWSLMYVGEVAEMARRLPRLLKAAHERDDCYAEMNLSLVLRSFIRLAANEPERARQELDEVMKKWPSHSYHVQHMNRLIDEVQIDLYLGDGTTALRRLTEQWPSLVQSHFLRIQQVYIIMLHLRTRGALAAAVVTASPNSLLRVAEKDARRLEREGLPWSSALARLVRAGIAALRGDATGSRKLLADAARLSDLAAMRLHAAAARRQLGELVGGTEGKALVAHADLWMAGQGIQAPGRMAGLLVPGFATGRGAGRSGD